MGYMPTTEEIRAKALELFFRENPEFGITPEDYELKEGGYWERARAELMRKPELHVEAEMERAEEEYKEHILNEAEKLDLFKTYCPQLCEELGLTKCPELKLPIQVPYNHYVYYCYPKQTRIGLRVYCRRLKT